MKLDEKKRKLINELRTLQIFVIVVCVLSQLISMTIPYLISKLIDNLENQDMKIFYWSGVVLGLVFFSFFLNWIQNYQWFKLMFRGEISMRSMMFNSIMCNPYSFFVKNKSGDISNRILNDSAQYADNYLTAMPMLLLNCITLILTFAFVFSYSIPIGFVLLVICLLYFFSYMQINVQLRKCSAEERNCFSELLQTTNKYYEGIPTIKLFLKEIFFSQKYKEKVEELGKRTIQLQLWKSLAQSLSGLIIDLMPIVSIIIGVFLTTAGKCTIGAIFGIYAYTAYLGEPIRNLTDLNLGVQRAKVNKERLEELLIEQPKEEEFEENIDSIVLDNICVTYDGSEKILNNFKMELHKGDRIGVVGSSGCGKSTLTHVLMGELQPISGKVLVNGRNVNLSTCCKRIAVLPQNIFLYDESVIDNILFGNDCVMRNEVLDVINVEHFANRTVNELSGGEKRRIGLARALMKDFDLLILDEPTAEIDSAMEEKIISYLEKIIDKEKMLLVITHRPKILELCNKKINL